MADNTKKLMLKAQINEITEYHIYRKLAETSKDSNKKVLNKIAEDELRHYNFWKTYTKKEASPKKITIWFYYIISRLLGLTFGLKLMERGEELAQKAYNELSKTILKVREIEKEEKEHENNLINMINEEKIKYVGSIVLGLNDALVELTGAIAGFTFAFQNTKIVGAAALVTGIAASFSMSASEYLSTKTEDKESPVKASIYTGIAYIIAVIALVIPYFLLKNYYFALGFTLINAIIIIFLFTFYISVAKEVSFKKRFFEMAVLSFGVAALTFIIGLIIRVFLQIDI
ncbi:MAG: VIT1/CCC1 transporter family protein [Candidatus Woesearchaeota archaeon]|jgi:VIT1/CCC1 family predicted Fe2+/Mn2+ transporter|nr:VIT1/CCC1 transporter family protein [Candidatus Woesearchaeota archaeon]MDP7622782.1 VIT1/CCC1 transporter family protein [Candidatus Woesearchaeota archaeon]HJN56485.1 VIT1/CCC1 transporter family protein [Candidatus Woesearchaeota archaeon]|tara:strand:+ start:17798 stop:18658 length:861 start_codon:yes stop_codon:yes gene_type:complete